MATVLKIVDEFFGSGTPQRQHAVRLTLASERISARELICRRIRDEIAALHRESVQAWLSQTRTRSFLIPVEERVETRLNPERSPLKRPKPIPIDEKAEMEAAVQAFTEGKFILLLDDRQVDDLDEEVTLSAESEALFIYLMPLKGG